MGTRCPSLTLNWVRLGLNALRAGLTHNRAREVAVRNRRNILCMSPFGTMAVLSELGTTVVPMGALHKVPAGVSGNRSGIEVAQKKSCHLSAILITYRQ